MRIVKMDLNNDFLYTIELEENVLIDVKFNKDEYKFICTDDGYSAYDWNGNSFDYNFNALEVINFLKNQLSITA